MAKAKDLFDVEALTFPGSPVDQARLLLRTVKPLGVVSSVPAAIPAPLNTLLARSGETTDWLSVKSSVEQFLENNGIVSSHQLGGSLSTPLSKTRNGHPALYFVIHDTSSPTLSVGSDFPPNINDETWHGNRLESHADSGDPVAHLFVNRIGESATGHDFSVAKYATKFERNRAKLLEGRFLHIELIQPRVENAQGIDEFAPTPGFSDAQLVRLALLYICASVRAKNWLIPAFHCVLDEGIPNGHDDPQHFSLADWGEAIGELISQIDAAIV